MSLKALLLASALALAAASAARAGETACWYEGGVVIVPAEVAGVAGDYILDTAEPQTILAESQAQGAGYADTAFPGDVALAGQRAAAAPLVVKAIDVRTGLFPTPIAGVIGADVLKAYVVDLSFTPCRLRLSAPGAAPAFGPATRVKLDVIAGLPAIEARVSDGTRTLTGDFLISTGADAPIRLSDAIATAPGAQKPMELYPNGVLRPTLTELTFAGHRFEDLLAGLMTPPDPQIAGLLGAPLFHDLRLRIDVAAGEALIGANAASHPRAKRDRGERIKERGGSAPQRAGGSAMILAEMGAAAARPAPRLSLPSPLYGSRGGEAVSASAKPSARCAGSSRRAGLRR